MFKVWDYVRTTKEWNRYWCRHDSVEGVISEIVEKKRRVIKRSCDKLGCAAFIGFEVTDEFETIQLFRLENYDWEFHQEDIVKDEKETLIQRILKFANLWYANPKTYFADSPNRIVACFNEAYDNTIKFNPGTKFSLVEIEEVRKRFNKNIIRE